MFEKLKRAFDVVWIISLLFLACYVIITPALTLGLIGFFIGVGFLSTVIISCAFADAIYNYITRGKFELTPNQST